MKKTVINFILYTAVALGLLFGGYYYFIYKPMYALPKAYLNAKKEFSKNKSALVESRVAYVELTRFNAQSNVFFARKNQLLDGLKARNEEAIKMFKDSNSLKSVLGIPTNELTTYNKYVKENKELKEKSLKALENQKKFIDSFIELDDIIDNVFEYPPFTDLGQLDPVKDKEELLNRANNTLNGIQKVRTNLDSYSNQSEDIKKLKASIDSEIDLLKTLIDQINSGNPAIKDTRQEFITKYWELKSEAYLTELSVIRTPESISMLADLTNVLLQYEYLADETYAKIVELKF